MLFFGLRPSLVIPEANGGMGIIIIIIIIIYCSFVRWECMILCLGLGHVRILGDQARRYHA